MGPGAFLTSFVSNRGPPLELHDLIRALFVGGMICAMGARLTNFRRSRPIFHQTDLRMLKTCRAHRRKATASIVLRRHMANCAAGLNNSIRAVITKLRKAISNMATDALTTSCGNYVYILLE